MSSASPVTPSRIASLNFQTYVKGPSPDAAVIINASLPSETVWSPGPTAAADANTVTLKEQTFELPQASVARQATTVVPNGNDAVSARPSLRAQFSCGFASAASATAGATHAFPSHVMTSMHWICGGVVSTS